MPFRIKLTVTVLAAVVVALLAVPLVLPIPALADTVSEKDLAGPDSVFWRLGELDLHGKQRGQGDPAIILLHGFGANVFGWNELQDKLAGIGKTVAYDRTGFGLSSRPLDWEGESPYGMAHQVALLDRLLDELGADAAVLIGHSAGATVAVNYALERPGRVLGLVLVSPAIFEGGGPPGWARPLLYTPQFDRLGPLVMRQFAGEPGESLIRASWSDPSRITSEVLERYRLPLKVHDWDRALWEVTRASRPPQLDGRLHELRPPVLVASGADDEIVPVEESRRAAEKIDGAGLVVIPNCGHVAHEECPDELFEEVAQFIEGLAGESDQRQ